MCSASEQPCKIYLGSSRSASVRFRTAFHKLSHVAHAGVAVLLGTPLISGQLLHAFEVLHSAPTSELVFIRGSRLNQSFIFP
jgi:hypothetical protein